MKRTGPWLICVLFVAIFLSLVSIVNAATSTYYVDFEGGNDANDGLSKESAWKHAPGDLQAEGNPAAIGLQPGATILFKGGVVYRGSIRISADGTSENPITFSGHGWGAGRAIIDGSEVLEGTWTRCESQQACAGNPDWQQIYSIPAPQGTTFFNTLFEEDEFLWFSQDPNPEDPFYYDRHHEYRIIPEKAPAITITRTSITDPRYFTQSDPNYWDGAYVAVWRIPNVVVVKEVTGFDPATQTIFFEDLGGDLYTDRDEYYSVLNHLSLIDRPGEYTHNSNQHRIYLWPLKGSDPSSHEYTYAERRVGLDIYGQSHLVIEGFQIQKFFGDQAEHGMGVAIRNTRTGGDPEVDIIIRENVVTKLRSMAGAGAIGLNDVHGVLIEKNEVIDNQRNIGIIAAPEDIIVRDNYISRCSRQGIWFMRVRNGQIINNIVEDIRGAHANGISVYLDSANILVANNQVYNAPSPFTFSGTENLTVINNIFDGGNGNNNVNEWGRDSRGVIAFLNNVLVRNNRNAALLIGSGGAERYVIANNIIDGTCPNFEVTDISHNIYTGLMWCQEKADFKEGEFLEEDLSKIFLDPESGDFHLIAEGLAVNSGQDISSFFPVELFPSFGYNADITGTVRPQGSAWDIGPYEYVSGSALLGDVNGDGQVDEEDVRACLRHILDFEDWGDHADVNNDGGVDVIDLQRIVIEITSR